MTTEPIPDSDPRPDNAAGGVGAPDARPGLASSTMTADPPGRSPSASLRRGGPDRMLAGVAVGLADYFDIDPTLVRVGFVVLSFLGGLAVPLYLAGWLLIPEEGADQSVAEELLARERVR
jgi:phage shock protein PspC (stress-responsive transcriptional regulator)